MPIWYLDLRPVAVATALSNGRHPRYVTPPALDLLTAFADEEDLGPSERPTLVFPPFEGEGSEASLVGCKQVLAEEVKTGAVRFRIGSVDELLRAVEVDTPKLVFIDLTGHGTDELSRALSSGAEQRPATTLGAISPALKLEATTGNAAQEFPSPSSPDLDTIIRDPVGRSINLTRWVNRHACSSNRWQSKPFAILIADAPREPPWISMSPITGLCVETIDRINQPLIKAVYEESHLRDSHERLRFAVRLQVPVRWRQIPPSLWGEYSPQSVLQFEVSPLRVLEADGQPRHERGQSQMVAIAGLLNEPELDFTTVSALESFESLLAGLIGQPRPNPTPRNELIRRNLVYLLGLSRKMATRTLEGKPFQCTVIATAALEWQSKVGYGLSQSEEPRARGQRSTQSRARAESIPQEQWCLRCASFAAGPASSFLFSDRSIANHIELIQAEDLVLIVDAVTLRVLDIVAHRHREDWYRAMCYNRLANAFQGVAVHMRYGCHVEVYDSEKMQLWYDGFSWRARPFEEVWTYLREFFGEQRDGERPQLTGRVIGALFGLQDLQVGSMIAFVDEERLRSIDVRLTPDDPPPGRDPVLRPLRGGVTSALTRPPMRRPPIKSLSLAALIGLLKVDGAHVITQQGALRHLAHQVTDGPAVVQAGQTFPGTGREAARRLSWRIRGAGFVVKVSASGGLHVFVGGQRMGKYRSLWTDPETLGGRQE